MVLALLLLLLVASVLVSPTVERDREVGSPDPEWLHAREVAQRIGVSVKQVYRLIAEQELPAVRIRGSVRVPRARLDIWMRDRENAPFAPRRKTRGTVAQDRSGTP